MIALVCIAKNEDNYLEEWILYHKKLGFDSIYIYQNDWRAKIRHRDAIYLEIDGSEKQVLAYNNFIRDNRKHYEWAAFFDVDEYLVLNKHKTVRDLLNDYNDKTALGVNWYLFGDNGLKGKIEDYSSIKRFTKRQAHVNPHIKTILNLKKCSSDIIMDIHNPNIAISDTNHNVFSGSFNHNGPTDVVQLNHYFCRTKTEFIAKCQRGLANFPSGGPKSFRSIQEFNQHNFNEVEDLKALNFMYG